MLHIDIRMFQLDGITRLSPKSVTEEEVTTFDEYSLSEPVEKQPARIFAKASRFSVKDIPNSLCVSILVYARD